MNPTFTKNYKETPLKRSTEVKGNSYELIGIYPRMSSRTDLTSEVDVSNRHSEVGKQKDRIGGLLASGLITSWNPCGTICESPF